MAESTGFRYRYLLGAMQQLQMTMTVRTMAMPEEVAKLPAIIERWRAASARMQKLQQDDAGAADQVAIEDPPAEIRTRLESIARDPLFQASFSDLPTRFGLVAIDNLVAPQRDVNLDYVQVLRDRLAAGKSLSDLVGFCLETRADPPEINMLQTAPNQVMYTSRSLDLRFLGGFPKEINESDVRAAQMGGQPVAIITLLIGFGAAPINGFLVGRRVVLANGFHRIVALRSEGITAIPMVLRQVANPEIEFPDEYLGLSRGYLLGYSRPVLIKDFFDDELIVEVRLKPRRKSVKVSWGREDGIVPE